MDDRYLFETFGADPGIFDRDFTGFLNGKRRDGWKVKECSYCHGGEGEKTYASCLFKKHD